jgi:glutaredoxin 3
MKRDSRPPVVMYSTGFCPYCIRARLLLKHKGVAYEEIRVDQDPVRRREMERRSRRRTVPQIFIGEFHVGGYDDLAALERRGELDALLQGAAGPAARRGSRPR